MISISKKIKKEHKEIWDIVLYGSFIRGKYDSNDIDIAIILKDKIILNDKLELGQELKLHISEDNKKNIDIKCVDINDLLDSTFLARQGIIAEGYSLIDEVFLSEKFGFKTYALFIYSLKGLTNSQKKTFYYVLKGRRRQEGISKENIEELKPGVIKTPISFEEEFKEILKQHNIIYETKKAMFYSFS